ncbi:MAG: VacJ family lipoprotein [Oleiphilaceae bacterium]|nr:VacJ family lipoprotein [Oleiphilaceae bacterium]
MPNLRRVLQALPLLLCLVTLSAMAQTAQAQDSPDPGSSPERETASQPEEGGSGDSDPFGSEMGDPADARVTAEDDPFEGINRRIFTFNDFVDRTILLPAARGYRAVTPPVINSGITNVFSNLGELENILNSLLQGKGEAALISTGRFVFNSTFGLLGFFDVASHFELPYQDEDFGQTLGTWGVAQGPYLMVPFFGPSTPRDATGFGVDMLYPRPSDAIPRPEYYFMRGLWVLDLRSDLIPAEQRITGDRYTFIRNAYLQRREYQVRDGRIQNDPFASGDDEDLMLDDF